MDSYLNPAFKNKADSLSSKHIAFQRRDKKTRRKKIYRKVKLKYSQIIISFFLLVGFFFLLKQAYFFLIQWEKLNVKKVEVMCQRTETKMYINETLQKTKLGNIFLVDASELQNNILSCKWIKNVQVRKILPSSLKISVQERIPVAIFKKEKFYLIDKEGIILKEINKNHHSILPILYDGYGFRANYDKKMTLALNFLNTIPSKEQTKIKALDVSNHFNLKILLKGKQTEVILGDNRFSEKFALYKKCYPVLKNQFGTLKYIDLRFDDRIYIKPYNSTTKRDI